MTAEISSSLPFVEAGDRFVEKHDERLFGDGARKFRELAMPIGEVLRECRREVRHAELLEDVAGAPALFRLEGAGKQPGGEVGGDGLARANAELQVLQDREAVDELKVLEGACKPHAGPRMRRQVRIRPYRPAECDRNRSYKGR